MVEIKGHFLFIKHLIIVFPDEAYFLGCLNFV